MNVQDRISKNVDHHQKVLLEASHSIHENPELCFKEEFAHKTLCDLIANAGFEVQRGAFGLPTAFAARVGTSGPQIAILCEYDALAGIGHGCGHNVIGTAGVGAGIAAGELAQELNGRLLILGTPAEEGGGGKIQLLENGAFEDVDAAIMLHPASYDLSKMNTLAVRQLNVTYKGSPAHSAASPHKGVNALDAGVFAYNAIAALRQHIRPMERIHGIFLQAGVQVNVVPDITEMHWQIRSDTSQNLEKLIPRVMKCLKAGAQATGCDIETETCNPDYYEMRDNEPLLALYISNAALQNRLPVEPSADAQVAGSTDMGNISHHIPSIHPLLKIAPADTSLHTPEFANCAISAEGDRGVIEGAKILAGVAADFWSNESTRFAVKSFFEEQSQN